jgi:hypothetical protein
VAYESIYENFEAARAGGNLVRVVFKKAGVLAGVDQPELYFFEVNGERAIVGILSGPLAEWQKANRYLSREEKIDVVGLFLKRALESEMVGTTNLNLMLAEAELEEMVASLGLRAKR